MAEEGATLITLRNTFYRDSYRRVMLVLLLSIIVNVVLIGVLYYQVTHPPKPRYFATSINGRITPLYPLSRPNQTDAAIATWANRAAIAAYSYNFVNYRSELEAASGFFTPQGWRNFLQALKNSNNLEAVTQRKLIVSAVPTSSPIFLSKGLINGRYTWRVQMNILVTFQNPKEFSQQNNVITMLITRISTLNSPRGIGISQFIVRPGAA